MAAQLLWLSSVLKFYSWRSRASQRDKWALDNQKGWNTSQGLPSSTGIYDPSGHKYPFFSPAQVFAQPQDGSSLIPSPPFRCWLLLTSQNIQLPAWKLTGLNKFQPPLHLLLKQQKKNREQPLHQIKGLPKVGNLIKQSPGGICECCERDQL